MLAWGRKLEKVSSWLLSSQLPTGQKFRNIGVLRWHLVASVIHSQQLYMYMQEPLTTVSTGRDNSF